MLRGGGGGRANRLFPTTDIDPKTLQRPDSETVRRVVTDTATSIVSNLAVAISTVIAMWLLDWRLALLSLAMLPIFAVLTRKVGQARREVTSSTQRSLADMTTILEETLSVSGVLL